ncbi:protein of unknown function [Streptantibioticus cattleyicolor NRRL 8057 = DSM 46488]|nr:protein of unknown function [Streptantibioticus cattleyicolor NRRL 8057 = DSM 46488]
MRFGTRAWNAKTPPDFGRTGHCYNRFRLRDQKITPADSGAPTVVRVYSSTSWKRSCRVVPGRWTVMIPCRPLSSVWSPCTHIRVTTQ